MPMMVNPWGRMGLEFDENGISAWQGGHQVAQN
jgi:hypothetical protein